MAINITLRLGFCVVFCGCAPEVSTTWGVWAASDTRSLSPRGNEVPTTKRQLMPNRQARCSQKARRTQLRTSKFLDPLTTPRRSNVALRGAGAALYRGSVLPGRSANPTAPPIHSCPWDAAVVACTSGGGGDATSTLGAPASGALDAHDGRLRRCTSTMARSVQRATTNVEVVGIDASAFCLPAENSFAPIK